MRVLLLYLLFFGGTLAIDCKNGVIVKDDASNPTDKCDCLNFWSGDDCEKIECINGGYPDEQQTKCHCPRGYYGVHCDAVKTAHPVNGVFDTKPSFNLFIHNEITDFYGLKAFNRLKKEVSVLSDYQKYFDEAEVGGGGGYNLIVSSASTTTPSAPIERTHSTTFDAFNQSISSLDQAITNRYSCAPSIDLSYSAILEALKDPVLGPIEDSVLLLFTQYPSISDKDDLSELKKYLSAYRITLNVIIAVDDVLLDCKPEAFDELNDLVYFTNGEVTTFLIETDDEQNEMMSSFISLSAHPQVHHRSASQNCQSPNQLQFQVDASPNWYYIAVRTSRDDTTKVTGTCSSGGQLVPVSTSYFNEFSLYKIYSGGQQICTFDIESSGQCISTAYSIGAENVDSLSIFSSFSSRSDMDSDSIHAYKDESFYITLHIEYTPVFYQVTKFSGDAYVNIIGSTPNKLELIGRQSTFDLLSTSSFKCPEENPVWIQFNLTGSNIKGEDITAFSRIINVNCEERKVDPVNPSGLRVSRSILSSNSPNKPYLALLYSNQLGTTEFGNFIFPTVDDHKAVMEEKFNKFGNLRFDSKNSMTFNTVDYDTFQSSLYANSPSKDDAPSDLTVTLILSALQQLTTQNLNTDSLVSIAVTTPLSTIDPIQSTNTDVLSNMGAKLLFIADPNKINSNWNVISSIYPYTRMAAATAGHFIIMDMTAYGNGDDSYLEEALNDLYAYGPSQRLLAYSNPEWEMSTISPTTGSVEVPESATEIFFTMTLNLEKPIDILTANKLGLLSLQLTSDGVDDIYVPFNLNQYGTISNLYTAKINVTGGITYDYTLILFGFAPWTGAHIRFWVQRDFDNDILPDLSYVDFDMKSIQPDDVNGAALRVNQLEDGDKVDLQIFDSNGQLGKKFDSDQEDVESKGGVAHFIPYFCSSNQTGAQISKDLYTIKITYNNGFKYYRPMLCGQKTKPDNTCTVEDNEGNVFCKDTVPPFHRGPSGKLTDCSQVGKLNYYENGGNETYVCDCTGTGYTGASCEQGTCKDANITREIGDGDAQFRTLSYVLINPSNEDYCSFLVLGYLDAAKAFFKDAATYDNIWQYTFTIYFGDGTARTMYRGPDYDKFYSIFDKINDEFDDQPEDVNYCGSGMDSPMNMSDIFERAVESVGRSSRGIVYIYATDSFIDFGDDLEANLEDIIVDEEFYEKAQAYKQQIYFITPTLTDDIVALSTSTGGMALTVPCDDDETQRDNVNDFKTFFDGILQSQVGWAAVKYSYKKDDKITVPSESELFICTNTTLPAVTDCGVTTITLTPLSESETAKCGHVKITNSLCFTDTESDDNLLEIVVLTKTAPILSALIGNGQPNRDSDSAAATLLSSKAVHLSFDQSDKTYEIKPKDTNWREAGREECVFAQEFVPFEVPFQNIGPYVVEFDVTDTSSSSTYSLTVPLAVSSTIKCENGGKFNSDGSFCECVDSWSGPTCSQPICGEGGRLTTHGDHCDCSNSLLGGVFCTGE